MSNLISLGGDEAINLHIEPTIDGMAVVAIKQKMTLSLVIDFFKRERLANRFYEPIEQSDFLASCVDFLILRGVIKVESKKVKAELLQYLPDCPLREFISNLKCVNN